MTLSQIAYSILNTASGGKTSNDLNVSFRQVMFWINYHRANIIKELYEKSGIIHPLCFQHVVFTPQQNSYDISENPAYVETFNSNLNDTLSQGGPEFSEAGGHNIAINLQTDQTATAAANTIMNPGINYSPRIYFEFLDPYGRKYGNDLTYGDATYKIRELLFLDRDYAVRDCKVRINDTHFQTDWTPVPIVSMDEWEMGKFNKFTSKMIKAVIHNSANYHIPAQHSFYHHELNLDKNQSLITFHNLKSILVNSQGNDGTNSSNSQVIDYDVHFRGIFAEPQKLHGYDVEVDDYPFPPEYISKLIETVLSKEMNIALNTNFDGIADETDSAKLYGQTGRQKVQE